MFERVLDTPLNHFWIWNFSSRKILLKLSAKTVKNSEIFRSRIQKLDLNKATRFKTRKIINAEILS